MNAVEIYRDAESDLEHNRITLGEFNERIKPLTDVEHVVRCKDCRFSYVTEHNDELNTTKWACSKNYKPIRLDFYCADGERWDGNVE